MKAGFIGLGTMGASMAANLQKGIQKDGHVVLVHDVRRDAAAPHIKNGAVWADSPAALAAECDVIFSSLPGPVEFEAVSYGESGPAVADPCRRCLFRPDDQLADHGA